MKTQVCCLAIAAVTVLGAPSSRALDVGQQAPQLSLAAGRDAVDLTQLRGKYVYVDFWASWCGPCVRSFPWMNEMQAKFGPQGLVIVGVNLDEKREDAERFLTRVPAQFRVVFDAQGESAKRFGIKGMPSSVLIGPDGKVIKMHAGFRDEQRSELEATLAAALRKDK